MDKHAHGAQTTTRLALSLGITLIFVFIEALAGLIGNSLALLTDAAHNFTDVIALGLSWHALRLATKPANARKTFGYHRAGILVALVNSTTLVLIAIGIFYEAYKRFVSPPQVDAPLLIGVGIVAFFVNAGTAWLVHRGSESDLNLRSTFLHLMGDVMSTLGAVAAGIVIYFTELNWLDPLVSVLIGLLILWNAWGILRQTIHILLESAPENVDVETMLAEIRNVDGVLGVHDLHIWSINENLRALSAHVVTADISIRAGASIQRNLNHIFMRKYNIQHATLQLECEGCKSNLLFCEIGNGDS
jgi:cobalt-zinc-cadmium efflux system protein